MVDGDFGVFDGPDCLARFSDDEAAEEYRCEALELHLPVGFRRSAYDDLQVREVPRGYDLLYLLLVGLRRSRNQDLTVQRALAGLELARQERNERGPA
jgi:hypothetical protein